MDEALVSDTGETKTKASECKTWKQNRVKDYLKQKTDLKQI